MNRYPFAAIVGQERLKQALVLNAIDPGLGGVLICGEKGTAKSTAARALSELLPMLQVRRGCLYHSSPSDPWPVQGTADDSVADSKATDSQAIDTIPVPFVELPLGATEDRVVGTLDLGTVLRERRQAFHPGLLAAANRGILYVDEINLLADHLVDLLLDAAASGVNVVQRDGIEVTHPARFQLIGTMNPEEGQLRPQLLDRFGLMVEVAAPRDSAMRVEVVRRRMQFEADPAGFCAAWQAEQDSLRDQIVAARERLASVRCPDPMLQLICHICCEMQVDGLRADIALQRTACGLAALHDEDTVTALHIREAAELVLPHRRRRKPFEKPGLDQQQLDDLLPPQSPPVEQSAGEGQDSQDQPLDPNAGRDQNAAGENDRDADSDTSANAESTFAAASQMTIPPIQLTVRSGSTPAISGRRNQALQSGNGRFVRAVSDPDPSSLAVSATIRSAARNAVDDNGLVTIRESDLHGKICASEVGTLVLFVVDASGSMAARRRMEAVKGAVLSLLMDAYQQRDRVAVISFRGAEAELLLPPTNSLDLARDALDSLPTGGRTPLAHALLLATQLVRRERRSTPDLPVLCVILTDGKANVALNDNANQPWPQSLQAAVELADENVAGLVLDTDQDFVRLGRANELAATLQAEYRQLDDLSADSLTLEIRQRRQPQFQTSRTQKANP